MAEAEAEATGQVSGISGEIVTYIHIQLIVRGFGYKRDTRIPQTTAMSTLAFGRMSCDNSLTSDQIQPDVGGISQIDSIYEYTIRSPAP